LRYVMFWRRYQSFFLALQFRCHNCVFYFTFCEGKKAVGGILGFVTGKKNEHYVNCKIR
jgi:hypothetical protein